MVSRRSRKPLGVVRLLEGSNPSLSASARNRMFMRFLTISCRQRTTLGSRGRRHLRLDWRQTGERLRRSPRPLHAQRASPSRRNTEAPARHARRRRSRPASPTAASSTACPEFVRDLALQPAALAHEPHRVAAELGRIRRSRCWRLALLSGVSAPSVEVSTKPGQPQPRAALASKPVARPELVLRVCALRRGARSLPAISSGRSAAS